ncbi:hypothetical protein GGR56DRAFT_677357 [Xylariaceae sp. FL0804]|nr:hypothetical protein GGR56DRAFT_677357 [Xylariaceae sp. FL0804]
MSTGVLGYLRGKRDAAPTGPPGTSAPHGAGSIDQGSRLGSLVSRFWQVFGEHRSQDGDPFLAVQASESAPRACVRSVARLDRDVWIAAAHRVRPEKRGEPALMTVEDDSHGREAGPAIRLLCRESAIRRPSTAWRQPKGLPALCAVTVAVSSSPAELDRGLDNALGIVDRIAPGALVKAAAGPVGVQHAAPAAPPPRSAGTRSRSEAKQAWQLQEQRLVCHLATREHDQHAGQHAQRHGLELLGNKMLT